MIMHGSSVDSEPYQIPKVVYQNEKPHPIRSERIKIGENAA